MVQTLKKAYQKTNGKVRAKVFLNSNTAKGYSIELEQFDSNGYYQAHKSHRIVEFTELDNALNYFDELLMSNKLEIINQ